VADGALDPSPVTLHPSPSQDGEPSIRSTARLIMNDGPSWGTGAGAKSARRHRGRDDGSHH
jgi:hypothetical protein